MNKWYSTEDYRVKKVNQSVNQTDTTTEGQKMNETSSYDYTPNYGTDTSYGYGRKGYYTSQDTVKQSQTPCIQCQNQSKCDCQCCDCSEKCPCNGWWGVRPPWDNKPQDNMGIGGLEVELTTNVMTVDSQQAIPFNTQVARYTPDLALVDGGKIMVTKTGVYQISWWVATESVQMGQDTYAAFGMDVNGTRMVIGMSANAYGQVVGMGMMHVYASPYAPAYLRLVNVTDAQIAYGQVPIKSHLVIAYTKG